jgi:uncharacterized integral membrane protein
MRLALVLILVVLAVVLAVQNANVVSVSVFAWRLEASLAVIIALCFLIGAMVAALALAPGIYRRRADQRKLHRRIADLEARVGPEQVDDAQTGSVAVSSSRTDGNSRR